MLSDLDPFYQQMDNLPVNGNVSSPATPPDVVLPVPEPQNFLDRTHHSICRRGIGGVVDCNAVALPGCQYCGGRADAA